VSDLKCTKENGAMKRKAEVITPQPDLRQQAETLLQRLPKDIANLSAADLERLLHELHIHQVELDLQNEELRGNQGELQIARDKYTELYNFAPVGYLTLDRQGTILEANLTAATQLGVARIALVGMPLSRFVARDDQDVLYLHRRHMMEQEPPHLCELHMQRADGTSFIGLLRSRVVRNTTERVNQHYMILSDITALKQAEAARQQAERLASLGTFAAGLAHELNNPLYVIASTAEHARDELLRGRPVDEMADYLAEILADAERCAQIVKRVLNFARQGHPDKTLLDLHGLVQEIYEYLQHHAEQHGVLLRLSLAHAQPYVVANRDDIGLALVNLIHNAIEACLNGGHVTVATTVEAEHVQMQVIDTGVGLSQEELQKVFDPFYTTRHEAGGTGLGLSLTHRIITDHRGSIELQSVLGQGTTVCVRLPLAPPEALPTT
jgi:two-component system cell cycle sensor histidine kinase/response regulator CckA